MKQIIVNFAAVTALLLMTAALGPRSASAQAETIESLTQKIASEPKVAAHYMARAELYSDLASETELPENLPWAARAAADYSAYLRLKSNDAQALRMRALARGILFIDINPFSAADTRRAYRLNPRDLEARDELRSQAAEYPKFYRSKECRDARVKNAYRDHPSDEPLTAFGKALDVQLTADPTVALKHLACGANPNYIYPRSGQPEIFDFVFLRIEHVIAMLEAGANPDLPDRNGRTPLMKSLNALVNSGNAIDDAVIEKFRVMLDYGANPNARDRSGQSVIAYARQSNDKKLIDLFTQRGAK